MHSFVDHSRDIVLRYVVRLHLLGRSLRVVVTNALLVHVPNYVSLIRLQIAVSVSVITTTIVVNVIYVGIDIYVVFTYAVFSIVAHGIIMSNVVLIAMRAAFAIKNVSRIFISSAHAVFAVHFELSMRRSSYIPFL